MIEEIVSHKSNNTNKRNNKSLEILNLNEVSTQNSKVIVTSLKEFNRVMGGGIVPASVILISGEPGIGKSTFLLQLSNLLAEKNSVLYVSGEESLEQIKTRANRLNTTNAKNIKTLSTVELPDIEFALEQTSPDFVIIDSIQALYHPDLTGAQGNVSQVRECSSRLFRLAKEKGFTLLLVGHVTKEGSIAGPRVLEHLVDVVLYFEGNSKNEYRILRSRKNRFGNTFELAIYKMTSGGLAEVTNTSQLFLEETTVPFSGAAITAAYESQVLFMEVQALINRTSYGMPQRTVIGFDHRRLALILAIIEKRAEIFLKNYDVFVKLTGGLKIEDPAMDMAIVMAVISSFMDKILPSKTLYLGELGLGGEFKTVHQLPARVNDAIKLGFKKIFVPFAQRKTIKNIQTDNGQIIPVKTIHELLDYHK